MLMTIITTLVPILTGSLADAFKAYEQKQITLAELNAKVQEALISAFAEVQKSQSAALAATFASFMDGAKNSKLMRVVWAIVVLTQLGVLLWAQVGAPAFVRMFGGEWPSSGSTVDWAYLLVAACLGLGPVVLNKGPGKVDLSDLKTKIGK
jgi:hypothetical protein